MDGVTVGANLTDLESHMGDGPVHMPVRGLMTLIKLTEVGMTVIMGGTSP